MYDRGQPIPHIRDKANDIDCSFLLKLCKLTPEQRFVATTTIDSYIEGMIAQERLTGRQTGAPA